jgi:cell division protein FtsL
MDGFQKIDLAKKKTDTTSEPIDMPKQRRRKGIKFTKNMKIATGIVVVFILFLIFGLIMPGIRTYQSAIKTYRQAQLVAAAMKEQNVEKASVELAATKKDLEETQKNLNSLFYLRFVPIANWYYNDADHLVKAGLLGIDSATITIDAIKPYADVLGLKGQGTFTSGSAEDRIKTAVLTLGKITPQIDTISDSLVKMQKEVDQVEPKHYPKIIFGAKVNKGITDLRTYTDQGVEFVEDARPLIKVLPSLLGEKESKKYLVLFQNDKELRPTGGFITAYAIFSVDKGQINVERSDDIYNLDNSVPNKPRAPEPILKYLPKVPLFNLRDTNLSPDFITSMNTFREMYERAGQGVDVDGIIAIDTHVLVSTIKILDNQVTAGGITFTSDEDPRCECPQVIYELEDNISRPVGYIKEDRKGLLGDLLKAIMQKALSSSPSDYWGPLFQSLLTQTNEKHVMFYLYDKEAQKGIEALKAAGRIRNFDGDYLHVNDTNFGGAKSNLFVDQEIKEEYNIQKDGTIQKTITIDYVNPHAPSNCSLLAGGLCLNAELRDWLRIYVPKGSKLVDSKGSEVKITTYEELGKTVFDGFITVRPRGKKTFTITYTLPFKLKKGSPLPYLIQKQGGKEAFPHKITVNGRVYEEFSLDTDKEFQLKIR